MASSSSKPAPTSYAHIWHLSWPIMVSNLSQPLVGAADTAMMGHLADTALIGGVALGTIVIHFLLMIFGFLRMSTTALTSQAFGAGDDTAIGRPLQRGVMIGAVFGALFWALSSVITSGASLILPASPAVEGYMASYISIQLYAMPALLMNAALLGWLYGMQSMRLGMIQLLLINGLNIALNLIFVLGFGAGIEGVALASVIANWVGFFFVVVMLRHHFAARIARFASWPSALLGGGWSAYGALSRDIIIRTLLLYLVELALLYQAGKQGDIPLAALQIILVIFGLIAYSLDGFAHASEALIGNAIGKSHQAKNKAHHIDYPSLLRLIIWRSTMMAGLFSVSLSLSLFLFSDPLLRVLTSHDDIINTTKSLWLYVLLLAPAAFLAFQMDGIFIGAAMGRALRNGMILSFSLFVAALILFSALPQIPGLDGVLLAFILYLITRGLSLVARLPDLFALSR